MGESAIGAKDRPVVACDMTGAPDTPQQRIDEYGQLFTRHLIGRERTGQGIRFRLRAEAGVEAWVRDLSAREKACCRFADFAVATADGEVRWDITVLDDDLARAALDEFYRLPESTGQDWPGMRSRLADLGFTVTTGAGPA